MAQSLSAVDDEDTLYRQNPWQSSSEDAEDENLTDDDDVSEESFLVEAGQKKTGGIRSRWQGFTGKFRNRRCCACIHLAKKKFRGVRLVFDFIKMIYYIVVSRWLNALIVFVPIGMTTFFLRSNPAIIFITNALAIVPLSALLTEATERIAERAGETIGALLNISLGNLVELILFVALANGHVRIVKASILGSILVNLLLILGTALLACSISGIESSYDISGTEVFGCLLFVSVFTFMMPTAFDLTFRGAENAEGATLKMSRVSAFLVLAIYVVYVIYELTSTAPGNDLPTDNRNDLESQPLSFIEQQQSATPRPHGEPLPLPPRTIRFAEEQHPNPNSKLNDDNAEEVADEPEAGMSLEASLSELRGRLSAEGFKGPVSGLTYQRFPRIRDQSRSLSLVSSRGRSRDSSLNSIRRRFLMTSALPSLSVMRSRSMEDYRQGRYVDRGSQPAADAGVEMVVSVFILVLSSALMSMNAEFLVSTIDEVTHNGHLSESLIGLIILPIVGNVAEYITVVSVAVKEKLDLAVAVSLGSSIQIALCVTPLTVIAGWVLNKDLDLSFNFFEIATLIGSVLVVNLIVMSEGGGGLRANALHGALMCGCYAIIGMGAYMAPEI